MVAREDPSEPPPCALHFVFPPESLRQLMMCKRSPLPDTIFCLRNQDLISADETVMGYKTAVGTVLQHCTPPVRRVPPAVFKRLVDDVGGYAVERGARGGTVLVVRRCLNLHICIQ